MKELRQGNGSASAAEQLASMNVTERTAARGVLETMNLPTDRRSRLLEALR